MADMNKFDLTYIIDDDEITIYLAERVINKVELSKGLEKFTNGMNAINRLRFAVDVNENIPDLILFDLNMPQTSGWEFIEEFSKLPISRQIPTFIFTSSITPREIEKSKEYPAINGIILKPLCLQKINKMLRIMDVDVIEPNEKVFVPRVHSSYYLNTGTGI